MLDEDEDGNKKEERCDAKTRAYLSSVDLAWGLAEAVFFTRVRPVQIIQFQLSNCKKITSILNNVQEKRIKGCNPKY